MSEFALVHLTPILHSAKVVKTNRLIFNNLIYFGSHQYKHLSMANLLMISANECEEALTLNKESVFTSTPVKVIIFISYIDNRRLEFKLKALSGNFVGP